MLGLKQPRGPCRPAPDHSHAPPQPRVRCACPHDSSPAGAPPHPPSSPLSGLGWDIRCDLVLSNKTHNFHIFLQRVLRGMARGEGVSNSASPTESHPGPFWVLLPLPPSFLGGGRHGGRIVQGFNKSVAGRRLKKKRFIKTCFLGAFRIMFCVFSIFTIWQS